VIRWEQPAPGVVLAVIDRPERRNALDDTHCLDLAGRIEGIDAASGTRALVITGAGSAFCSGADLGRRAADVGSATGSGGADATPSGGLKHGGGDSMRPAFERLVSAVVALPAPVIAAVNGAALGAGLQLAVACDLRVVSERANLGIPASRLGVLLGADNVARLAGVVGRAWARDLLVTGRTIDAAEADRMGLVHRTAPDGEATVAAALSWAEEIATLAPLTVAGHKRALNLLGEAAAFGPEARAELEGLEAAAFASRDLSEGLAAFADKRTPRFEGR